MIVENMNSNRSCTRLRWDEGAIVGSERGNVVTLKGKFGYVNIAVRCLMKFSREVVFFFFFGRKVTVCSPCIIFFWSDLKVDLHWRTMMHLLPLSFLLLQEGLGYKNDTFSAAVHCRNDLFSIPFNP